MARKTEGVWDLAEEMLQRMDTPYAEDVIENVFLGIGKDADVTERHRRLEVELGHRVVNQWLGRYVREIAGMKVLRKGVPARRSNLTKTYSKLCY